MVVVALNAFFFSGTLNRYWFVKMDAWSSSVLTVLVLQSSSKLSLGDNRLHIMEASRLLNDDLHQIVVLHRLKSRTSSYMLRQVSCR